MEVIINNTPANRKQLRILAQEAMASYSPIMTWVVLDANGDLYTLVEPQGQSYYSGGDIVIATTGGFAKSCGEGAARDEFGNKFKTQKAFLTHLLGAKEYDRLFNKSRNFQEFEGREYTNDRFDDWY